MNRREFAGVVGLAALPLPTFAESAESICGFRIDDVVRIKGTSRLGLVGYVSVGRTSFAADGTRTWWTVSTEAALRAGVTSDSPARYDIEERKVWVFEYRGGRAVERQYAPEDLEFVQRNTHWADCGRLSFEQENAGSENVCTCGGNIERLPTPSYVDHFESIARSQRFTIKPEDRAQMLKFVSDVRERRNARLFALG